MQYITWLMTDAEDRPIAEAKNLTDARKKAYVIMESRDPSITAVRIYNYDLLVGVVTYNPRVDKVTYTAIDGKKTVEYNLYKNGFLGRRVLP